MVKMSDLGKVACVQKYKERLSEECDRVRMNDTQGVAGTGGGVGCDTR